MCRVAWGIPMWLLYSSCEVPIQLKCSSHTAPINEGVFPCGYHTASVWLPYSSRVEGTSHQSEILPFFSVIVYLKTFLYFFIFVATGGDGAASRRSSVGDRGREAGRLFGQPLHGWRIHFLQWPPHLIRTRVKIPKTSVISPIIINTSNQIIQFFAFFKNTLRTLVKFSVPNNVSLHVF